MEMRTAQVQVYRNIYVALSAIRAQLTAAAELRVLLPVRAMSGDELIGIA